MNALFALSAPLSAIGGAQQTMLEWAHGLRARGHVVQTVSLPGEQRPGPDLYWRWRARQRAELGRLVEIALGAQRPDVVVAQLHGAPAALAAATRSQLPGVLVLPSYESLCKLAFGPGSDCPPDGDCLSCPAASRLVPAEREALAAGRSEHDASLAAAAALVAPSTTIATAARRRARREPAVVRPVGPELPMRTLASPCGPVVCAAARWGPHKGVALLPALAKASRAAGAPAVRVTDAGLTGHEIRAIGAAGGTLIPTSPIDELLAGASLVLVPSQWNEPFGRIAWEALARGIPVLCSDAGGLAEFVPAELRVAPRDDGAAWAAAISRLLGDSAAWTAAAAAARPAAAKLLDPQPLEQLEQLLGSVARTPGYAGAKL
jgi:glycosyltransferase involved in cell wall biosynthesis